jgi:putative hydrolase of the HAD superfamily
MDNHKITLLIDADDTLWENNIYFEKVIDILVKIIKEKTSLSENEIKDCIWEKEKIVAKKHGYGSKSFVKALREVIIELIPELEDEHDEIFQLLEVEGKKIYEHPIKFFEGVEEHLEVLAGKYNLILVTKGDRMEQSGKIERAKIKHHFKHIEILPEKHPDAYEEIIKKHKLDKKLTWMIGNSPKSDINPSKKIGLNTILIPYHLTWELEKDIVEKGEPETIVLKRFIDIDKHITKIVIKLKTK